MCDDCTSRTILNEELVAENMKFLAHMYPSTMVELPPFPLPISVSKYDEMITEDPLTGEAGDRIEVPETGFVPCYEGYKDFELATREKNRVEQVQDNVKILAWYYIFK